MAQINTTISEQQELTENLSDPERIRQAAHDYANGKKHYSFHELPAIEER